MRTSENAVKRKLDFRETCSLLKNPLGARFDPGSGTNRVGFGAFGARFAGAIGPMPTFSTGCVVRRTSENNPSTTFDE
jgi:hypothetical protein